jgi:hypothetical protein
LTKRRFNTYKSYRADSKWEEKLRTGIFKNIKYHPKKISYTKPATNHKYEPDWQLDIGKKRIYIEAKGRFRDRAEYTKYLHIRAVLNPRNEELIFLFMKPSNPMPNAKRRKDGTIRTHAEWAEKEGFRWFDEKTIHTLLKHVGDNNE